MWSTVPQQIPGKHVIVLLLNNCMYSYSYAKQYKQNSTKINCIVYAILPVGVAYLKRGGVKCHETVCHVNWYRYINRGPWAYTRRHHGGNEEGGCGSHDSHMT